MAVSTEFRDTLRALVGKTRQGELVERTGISQAYINNMLQQGRVPRIEKLEQLADGLELRPTERARLFAAAGYSGEADKMKSRMTASPWPPHVTEAADLLCRLSEDEVAAVRRIAEMLATGRVIHSHITGQAAWGGVGAPAL